MDTFLHTNCHLNTLSFPTVSHSTVAYFPVSPGRPHNGLVFTSGRKELQKTPISQELRVRGEEVNSLRPEEVFSVNTGVPALFGGGPPLA